MAVSSAGAGTAPWFLRLPEPAAEKITGNQITVLLRQKNVLTGTTGGASSQGPPILPLTSGKGAREIEPPYPSHPIMRRRGADLEEKREPRVA
jgi:hypothetical protein